MEDQFIYENFDLLVDRGSPGSCRARVLRSPEGGESAPVSFTTGRPQQPRPPPNYILAAYMASGT
jgi:hypothetical protein